MLALTLLLLTATPEPAPGKGPGKGPPPSEMAKLFFLAGDLRRATETAAAGIKSEQKCRALYKQLVEYQYLAPRADNLTQAEAKLFLELDKKISPGTPGKMTPAVQRKYVDLPLQTARTAQQGDDLPRAKKFLEQALEVDPASPEALALKASLEPADAGVKSARDAGAKK